MTDFRRLAEEVMCFPTVKKRGEVADALTRAADLQDAARVLKNRFRATLDGECAVEKYAYYEFVTALARIEETP